MSTDTAGALYSIGSITCSPEAENFALPRKTISDWWKRVAGCQHHGSCDSVKRLAISQSNYIPWKGYFDMISRVDEFVLYDDVQFTRRDWRTRNQIKTPQGLKWLTIPVQSKGNYFAKINTIRVADKTWAAEHWKSLQLNYARAPFFKAYAPRIHDLYNRAAQEDLLSRVNFIFIAELCDMLGLKTKLSWSMDFTLEEGKNERLISICKQAGAIRYLSGPSARNYIDENAFRQEGIEVDWMTYNGYAEYPQLFGPFQHAVTILDVVFNVGPSAPQYIMQNNVSMDAAIPFPPSAESRMTTAGQL